MERTVNPLSERTRVAHYHRPGPTFAVDYYLAIVVKLADSADSKSAAGLYSRMGSNPIDGTICFFYSGMVELAVSPA